MATKSREKVGKLESVLAQAWSSWTGRRRGGDARLSDDEYVSAGKRSNSTQLAQGQDDDLFALLRSNDTLDEVLEAPYALVHVKDVHAAMQLAVASAGDQRDDLVRSSLFFPVFGAFVLGFAIGLVSAHRLKSAVARDGVAVLPAEAVERCEEWGIMVALYYLVKVEAFGIIDKETDQRIYGIADQWRLLADERRLAQFAQLSACVAAGKRAGEAWFHDESVEMGNALTQLLEPFIESHPNQSFN
jgi:hypothetical protein